MGVARLHEADKGHVMSSELDCSIVEIIFIRFRTTGKLASQPSGFVRECVSAWWTRDDQAGEHNSEVISNRGALRQGLCNKLRVTPQRRSQHKTASYRGS